MVRQISSGIDIGSHQTKVMVTEMIDGSLLPRIIGIGTAESKGLRRGFVMNAAETAKSVKSAVSQAEKTAGLQINKVFLSVGGGGVNAFWGQPAGMKGAKLEAKTFFITCLEQHLDNLTEAVELMGVKVENLTASPFPASLINLTKAQKIAGVALANIGAETTAVAVIENDLPVSLEVLPFGSADITNDIALGLKISLEEA